MHPNCEVFQFFLTTENHQFGMRNPRRYFGCGATRIPMHLVIWDPRTAPGFGKKMTISWNRFCCTFPNNNNNNNDNNSNSNTLDHPPWLNVRPLRAPRKPDRATPATQMVTREMHFVSQRSYSEGRRGPLLMAD